MDSQENEPSLPEGEIVISQEEANELLKSGLSQEQDLDIEE